MSHVVAEWAFTQGLKKLRETSQNSNQSEIAKKIGKSRATIGHYEMGRYLPSHDSLDIMLDAYGHGDRAAYYRQLRDRVEMHSPDWWEDEFPEHFPPKSLALLAGFEYSAIEMRIYEPQHVPELLQTPAYAEALLRAGLVGREADELTLHLRMLRGRQAVLDRADPPRLTCVLGESALRSPVGGPHVLGEQLNALVTLAQRNTIDIHVLPDSAGRPAGASGAFTTLSLPPGDHSGLPRCRLRDHPGRPHPLRESGFARRLPHPVGTGPGTCDAGRGLTGTAHRSDPQADPPHLLTSPRPDSRTAARRRAATTSDTRNHSDEQHDSTESASWHRDAMTPDTPTRPPLTPVAESTGGHFLWSVEPSPPMPSRCHALAPHPQCMTRLSCRSDEAWPDRKGKPGHASTAVAAW
ncbi:Helix-turn-helix [Saccharomonospora viridis]|uniref:helix-turn-helix domain-containing protein n=1 Tax=Saccharomonospora viridis TaxID=1852 RepID=UPI0008F353CB|nr:Helix-turn-helix [Saccharomonospora viridis]